MKPSSSFDVLLVPTDIELVGFDVGRLVDDVPGELFHGVVGDVVGRCPVTEL